MGSESRGRQDAYVFANKYRDSNVHLDAIKSLCRHKDFTFVITIGQDCHIHETKIFSYDNLILNFSIFFILEFYVFFIHAFSPRN